MKFDEVVSHLRVQAIAIEGEGICARWYIFGSATRKFSSAADIDVLIICSVDHHTIAIRQALCRSCMLLPLHLTILSDAEEHELQFVEKQNCSSIYPQYADN